MSQKLRTRPSSLLGVVDPLTAFYVDRAVFSFAGEVEEEMDAAEKRLPKNAKDAAHVRARQKVLDQYLGVESSEQPQRFRSIG